MTLLGDIADPLAFHMVPPAGQRFQLSGEISRHLQDGLAQMLVQTFLVTRG